MSRVLALIFEKSAGGLPPVAGSPHLVVADVDEPVEADGADAE